MSTGTLRQQVLRGGAYLSLRQALGTLINVGGALVLARLIGPGQYGLYAAAVGVAGYLQLVSVCGVDVYLVRHEAGPDESAVSHQAFTLLLVIGAGTLLVGCVTLPLVAAWTHMPALRALGIVVTVGVPLQLLTSVPLARLERALDYRRVAWIELSAQIAFFVVALPLAFVGLGAWAPVAGWWTQQLGLAVLCFGASRYRPRLRWDPAAIRPMVSYGLGYSASIWIWQLRRLVNPVIVGRAVGAEGVGIVALGVQIVTHLSFVAIASWRLSTAALARVQTDVARITGAVSEGMRLQIVAVGLPLVCFAWLGPWLVALFFGPAWAPVMTVYPFLALGMLASAAFNLHSSALYVRRHNGDVSLFHTAHILLFAGSAWWLVPRLGIAGYGWAEAAAILSYAVVHEALVRRVAAPAYGAAAALWLALGLALFWRPLGPLSLVGLAVVMVWPGTWRQLGAMWTTLRGVRA